MNVLLAYLLTLWILGGVVILFHQVDLRYGRRLIWLLLGALATVKAIGLGLVSLLQPQGFVAVELGSSGWLWSPVLMAPLIFMGLLAIYCSDGPSTSTLVIFGLSLLVLLVGMFIPVLGQVTPWLSQLTSNQPDGWAFKTIVRMQLPMVLAFVVSLLGVLICYRTFRARLGRWGWLAGGLSLLLGGTAYVVIYTVGASLGTSLWPSMLFVELVGWLIALVGLTPLLTGYLYWLERMRGIEEDGHSLSGVLMETLNLRRALEESQRRIVRLGELFELLADTRGEIVRSVDPEDLARKVCRRVIARQRFRLASIMLLDEDGKILRPIAIAGGREGRRPDSPLALSDPVLSGVPPLVALRTARAVVVNDLCNESESNPWSSRVLQAGCRSAAALPLQASAGGLGVMLVYSDQSAAFEAEHLSVLQGVADDLARGLEGLYLGQQRAQRVRELEALRELTAEMLSHHDVPTLLQTLVKKAALLLGGFAGLMFLSEPENDSLRCVVSYRTQRDHEGELLAFGDGPAGMAAQTGEPLIVEELDAWSGRRSSYEENTAHSALAVPMLRQGQVAGVIEITRGSRQPAFSSADLGILTLFANQATMALESAWLIDDIQRRAGQLEMLNELGRAAIAATELDELVSLMVDQMGGLVSADACCVLFWDGDAGTLVPPPQKEAGLLWGQPPTESIVARATACVLEGPEPLVVEDAPAGKEPLRPAGHDPRLVLVLPLVADGEKHGAVLAAFRSTRRFGREELGLCQQAAGQMALALAKIRALEAERRRSREMEALRQASLGVTSNLELPEVLETIIGYTLRMVAADDVHIYLYDGEHLRFGAARWTDDSVHQPLPLPRPRGLTYRVARSGERQVVSNVADHPLFEDAPWKGAICSIPLKMGGRVVGVMNVAFLQPHRFDEAELRALGLLADQVAIAIRNADLFGRMAEEGRRLQLLYDITRDLSRLLESEEIIRRAVELATENLRGHAGECYLLEPDSDRLRLSALVDKYARGLSAMDAMIDMRVGKGLVGWVAQHKEAVYVADVRSDARWLKVDVLDEESRSALCAPILAGERLLGVILIHGERDFEPGHLELLVAIARQVGLAISHGERYQQVRRRLAELTLLQQVAHMISRRLEMRPLIEEIVGQVGEVLGYPIVEIYLVEGDGLTLGASWGHAHLPAASFSFHQGVVGRVARTNEPANVPDVSLDPDFVRGYSETLSELAIPLRRGNVVVGVLNVESAQTAAFGQHDVRLLSLLADQISVALENAALYERLRQHANELGKTVEERTAELEAALQEARKADMLKTQFVSDVSHELRTPLSNIRLYLELLSKGKTERFDAYLDTLNRETDRLVALIEDLLAISRLDAGTAVPQPRPLDLNKLAGGLVEDRKRLLAEKRLEVEFAPQKQLPPVFVDEKMMSQVLANLMTNAMNYTPAGGRVTITTSTATRRGRQWVMLSVADTGVGISTEEQEHLFERFFRGSAGRQMGSPGTGLGLAICREILDRHGGDIMVKSKPGTGSTFTVMLPVGDTATSIGSPGLLQDQV